MQSNILLAATLAGCLLASGCVIEVKDHDKACAALSNARSKERNRT